MGVGFGSVVDRESGRRRRKRSEERVDAILHGDLSRADSSLKNRLEDVLSIGDGGESVVSVVVLCV